MKAQNIKRFTAMLLVALMVTAFPLLSTKAFAQTSDDPIVDPDINRGISAEFQGDFTHMLNLDLTLYDGLSEQFFVMVTAQNPQGTISLSLYDENMNLYSEDWEINCNEYKVWTVPSPPAGRWYLHATPSGTEGKVTIFAKWN